MLFELSIIVAIRNKKEVKADAKQRITSNIVYSDGKKCTHLETKNYLTLSLLYKNESKN